MKLSVSHLLSVNGGFVDTAGFLALQGLFTAHVTGNFVTFAATIVHGTSGGMSKLVALPVFCSVVILVRLARYPLAHLALPVLKTMLSLKIGLLVIAGALAITFGPFADPDAVPAFATGMVLVSAMAIQNAVHRVHLSAAPPTTLMTGTSTQIMLDLADLLHGTAGEERSRLHARLGSMLAAVAAFAIGCGSAALMFVLLHMWVFAIPPVIALLALLVRMEPPSLKP